MSLNRRFVSAWIFSLFLAVGLVGARGVSAAELTVRASVNPPRAQVGDWLSLIVEVNGAQNVGAPQIAQIPGFEVHYRGPSTQVSIVNGQMSATVQHVFQIQGKDPGHYTLGPFAVEHDGQRYQTAPIAVDILPAGHAAGAAAAGSPLKVTLSLPRTEIYLHERVPVDVTLYVGQVRVGDLQYPTIGGEGFSLDKFGEPIQRQEVVGGQTYQVVRFQTTLSPLRTGTLSLGPAALQLNVFERRRGTIFDDPFFSDRRPTSLRSETVQLNVLPLPDEGKPPSFTGAVGRFDLNVSASPTELNAGDPITLRVNLSGTGNLAELQAPALSSTEGFRIYDPRPAGGDESQRNFEQVLIPNDAGTRAIPPVRFSYFDPEEHRYRTVESAPIPLQVKPPQQPQKAEIIAGAAERRPAKAEELGRDIVYIKDSPGTLTERGSGLGLLFWIWQAVPLALAGAAFFYDRRRTRMTGDLRYARFTRAGKAAQAGLKSAANALQRNDRSAFYDTLEQTLRDYLGAKLDLPPGGVDIEGIARRGVPSEVAARLQSIFATCELARFSPAAGGEDMRTALQEAGDVIRHLERARGLGRAIAGTTMVLALLIQAASLNAAEPAGAASPQTNFFRGNTLYAESKYAEAATAYEQVLATGLESGPLYFNLGNAYFNAGDRGKAILNYERALRAQPGDPDTQANLAYARSLTGAEPCEPPTWARVLFPLASRTSASALAWIISAAYSFACLSYALYRAWPGHPRWLLQAAGALALVAAFTAGSAVYQGRFRSPASQAVLVAQGETAARFQPSETGTEYFRLKPGSLVVVTDSREGWSQIERCDGRRGWLPNGDLENISDR